MSAPADPMLPDLLPVRAVRRETSDVFTLELDAGAPGGRSFAPGHFNMLSAIGVGEAAISIDGDPAEPARIVHSIREVGNVTRALGRLKRGDLLGVRGPFGVPWPVEAAVGGDLVLIAGGIGLAPLKPVLHAVAARRAEFGEVSLLYGARTPDDLLFTRELDGWASASRVDVAITVDRAHRGWKGRVGVVTRLFSDVRFEPERTVAMICGPEVMMRFAVRELQMRGVAEERIFLSLERNMQCGIGHCGHCQLGPVLVCRDGPVFAHARVGPLLAVRGL